MTDLIARFDEDLASRFDAKLDDLIATREGAADLANFERVTPEAKHKLKGILQHYAKETHPFTACVRDNTKRFGQDRAERVCAVLKDVIYGTTKWRGKGNPKGVGPHPYVGLSEPPVIDEDVAELVDRLDEMELWELLGLAALEDGDEKVELRDFSAGRRQALAKKGHALDDGSYPIEHTGDLKNAVKAFGRAKNKGRVKAHIMRRARALGATNLLPEGWV